MALDNPVLPFGSRPLWRASRVIELAVVVGLTVAVVAVAATWGGSSTSPDADAVSLVEPAPAVVVEEPPATAAPQPVEQTAPASAESVAVEPATIATTLGSSRPAPAVPKQTGIVPGRPDPLDPATPASFERYQVQRGESLFSIAAARGISVADLVRWNWRLGADSVLIRGEWIWIPEWEAPIVADESGPLIDEGKSGRGGG